MPKEVSWTCTREASRADAALSVGALDPFHGWWRVRPRAALAVQEIPLVRLGGLQRRDGARVDAGPAARRLALRPGARSGRSSAPRVDPRVAGLLPRSSCRCVGGLWGHGRLRPGVGACAQGTCPPPRPSAPLAARCPRAATHGAFPRRQTCGVRRRRGAGPRSTAVGGGLVPASSAPLRLLAPPRPARRSRVSPRLPRGGFRPRLVCPGARPGVCGCHTRATRPPVWPIPGLPGAPAPLPPRVVRPPRGAMRGKSSRLDNKYRENHENGTWEDRLL
jgi:hypothetical protein